MKWSLDVRCASVKLRPRTIWYIERLEVVRGHPSPSDHAASSAGIGGRPATVDDVVNVVAMIAAVGHRVAQPSAATPGTCAAPLLLAGKTHPGLRGRIRVRLREIVAVTTPDVCMPRVHFCKVGEAAHQQRCTDKQNHADGNLPATTNIRRITARAPDGSLLRSQCNGAWPECRAGMIPNSSRTHQRSTTVKPKMRKSNWARRRNGSPNGAMATKHVQQCLRPARNPPRRPRRERILTRQVPVESGDCGSLPTPNARPVPARVPWHASTAGLPHWHRQSATRPTRLPSKTHAAASVLHLPLPYRANAKMDLTAETGRSLAESVVEARAAVALRLRHGDAGLQSREGVHHPVRHPPCCMPRPLAATIMSACSSAGISKSFGSTPITRN